MSRRNALASNRASCFPASPPGNHLVPHIAQCPDQLRGLNSIAFTHHQGTIHLLASFARALGRPEMTVRTDTQADMVPLVICCAPASLDIASARAWSRDRAQSRIFSLSTL